MRFSLNAARSVLVRLGGVTFRNGNCLRLLSSASREAQELPTSTRADWKESVQTASPVYCNGTLLHVVQTSRVFEDDDKTFVDLKQLHDPDQTLDNFNKFMANCGENPTRDEVKKFVAENFISGEELEVWDPPDWQEKPTKLYSIRDPSLRDWAFDLNSIWRTLSRRIKDEVHTAPQRYSLIPIPNGFIIPGGRFREIYYWDTYWILKGLLICGMKSTVRGMIENFSFMVKELGHIPNGGRIYYVERSQPPLYVPMIYTYVSTLDKTEGLAFLKEHIRYMDSEFQFWMKERTVEVRKDGRSYTLCRYYSDSHGPRPESYTDDMLTTQQAQTDEEREFMFNQIKSAAESGWDFSARWFIKGGTNNGNLSNINTQYIIPVDLNSFVWWNADLLAKFHTLLGNVKAAQYYAQKRKEWMEAINAVLWHEDIGVWLDYDILNNVRREYFYPTNIAPLWTGSYKLEKINVDKIVSYMKKNHIDLYPGGIPTSLDNTHEQWDFPNAWPPLQAIVIQGLDQTGHRRAQELAFQLAETWIRSNYRAYVTSGKKMFEKYDVQYSGRQGGGGEYHVQTGFGWTNGVVLELLNRYGSRITASSENTRFLSDRTNISGKQRSPDPRRHLGSKRPTHPNVYRRQKA